MFYVEIIIKNIYLDNPLELLNVHSSGHFSICYSIHLRLHYVHSSLKGNYIMSRNK